MIMTKMDDGDKDGDGEDDSDGEKDVVDDEDEKDGEEEEKNGWGFTEYFPIFNQWRASASQRPGTRR